MLTPKRKGSDYHHGSLQQSAILAAKQIVARKGVEGLGLRKVAEAIGVTPAALYRHFAGLEELRFELSKEVRADLGEQMAMSLQSLPTQKNAKEAAIARLVAIGNAYIDYAIENPKVFGIAFLNRDDSTTTEYTELSWTLLSDSISELARTGVISPAKAKTVPLVLWSLVHGCASLLASGSLSTRETNSFKDSVVEGLLEFIKSEGRLEVPDLTSQ